MLIMEVPILNKKTNITTSVENTNKTQIIKVITPENCSVPYHFAAADPDLYRRSFEYFKKVNSSKQSGL